MLSAFGTSTAFLISYVIYHWFKSGPKFYTGDWTTLYYFILFSHILLAAIIVPLALITLYRGWNNHVGRVKVFTPKELQSIFDFLENDEHYSKYT